MLCGAVLIAATGVLVFEFELVTVYYEDFISEGLGETVDAEHGRVADELEHVALDQPVVPALVRAPPAARAQQPQQAHRAAARQRPESRDLCFILH